jgi:hypothetical protein
MPDRTRIMKAAETVTVPVTPGAAAEPEPQVSVRAASP